VANAVLAILWGLILDDTRILVNDTITVARSTKMDSGESVICNDRVAATVIFRRLRPVTVELASSRPDRPTGPNAVPSCLFPKRGTYRCKDRHPRPQVRPIRSTQTATVKTVPERGVAQRHPGRSGRCFLRRNGAERSSSICCRVSTTALLLQPWQLHFSRWDRVRVSFGHATICKRCAGLKTGPGYNCGPFFL